MCATILSTGARRGAMMGTLRSDIEEFITAKQDKTELRHFNISVLITDDFMAAVTRDEEWPLLFPSGEHTGPGETLMQNWPGFAEQLPCDVYKRVPARLLWTKIIRAAYEYAEPGVLFSDRINRLNNFYYRERINAINPCGEVPLPPYGAATLALSTLPASYWSPSRHKHGLIWRNIGRVAHIAVRFLDNVIDISRFPVPAQAAQASGSRRIGLGFPGLADALMMLNIRYGTEESLGMAQMAMQTICHTAYRTSIELAGGERDVSFFR